MKFNLKEVPVVENPINTISVEATGYYGDADADDSFVMDFPSDIIDGDSKLLQELVETFDALENNYAGDYSAKHIPHWYKLEIPEYLPYKGDYFDQYMRVSSFTIYFYDV